MERKCEFCRESRPSVYCEADVAKLCLSCDARVHLANGLSKRHDRSPLCEDCQNQPASIRCLDHSLFMCNSCDRNLHKTFVQHRKLAVCSYTGCPTASDFAALWGYELKEWGGNCSRDCGGAVSVGSCVTGEIYRGTQLTQVLMDSTSASNLNALTSGYNMDCQVGSHILQGKIHHPKQQRRGEESILHQIHDLDKFHHNDIKNPLVQGQVQNEAYSTEVHSMQQHGKHLSAAIAVGVQHVGTVHREQQASPFFPLPLCLQDNVSSSLNYEIPFHEDTFSTKCSQLWSQNMLDLGVCEEIDFYDDFKIPDVDRTFRNYDELFSGDRSMFDGVGDACSSMEKDACLTKSNIGYQKSIETYISDYFDRGISSRLIEGDSPWTSSDLENPHSEASGNSMMRYNKEKKKA